LPDNLKSFAITPSELCNSNLRGITPETGDRGEVTYSGRETVTAASSVLSPQFSVVSELLRGRLDRRSGRFMSQPGRIFLQTGTVCGGEEQECYEN